MKNLLAILLVIHASFLSVQRGHAIPGTTGATAIQYTGPTIVGSPTICNSVASASNCSLAQTTVGGDCLWAVVGLTGSASIASIGTDAGDNFSPVASTTGQITSGGYSIGDWKGDSDIGGAENLSITTSTGGNWWAALYEVSSCTVDQKGTLSNQSASTSPVSPSLTATAGNELSIAAIVSPSGGILTIHSGNSYIADSSIAEFGFAHLTSISIATFQAEWSSSSSVYASNNVTLQ